MGELLVIGVYDGNHQRFAERFDAETVEQAEDMARAWADTDIIIAAVLHNGEVIA